MIQAKADGDGTGLLSGPALMKRPQLVHRLGYVEFPDGGVEFVDA
jgi:hypothetical protein